MMSMTCGECRHYVPSPPDPNNLGVKVGECREQLQFVVIPNPQTRSLELTPMYAIVPPNFPACARLEVAESVPALCVFSPEDGDQGPKA